MSKKVQVGIPACFMRGGTSKALVINEEDLKGYSQEQIDKIILAALGSPDPYGRQIDGLGGGISSLSKCCIIGKAKGDVAQHADVTYRFGQVEVKQPRIDWSAACGNIGSAAAHFAILSGIFDTQGKENHNNVQVRVWDLNTQKLFHAQVPVRNGEPEIFGDAVIPGVPGSGARIEVQYKEPGGTAGRGLLPTGKRSEEIGGVTCSVVDSSLVCVFVKAEEVDLGGHRLESILAPELDAMPDAMALLERIRREAAVRAGIASSADSVPVGEPKVVLVGPAGGFTASGGEEVASRDVDVTLRAVSVGNAHRTIPGTVAMCAAAASMLEKTTVHAVARRKPETSLTRVLHIGHPAGVTAVGVEMKESGGAPKTASGSEGGAKDLEVVHTSLVRSARLIMRGEVLVPSEVLSSY